MFLPCTDLAFGVVGTMVVWWDVLIVDAVRCKQCREFFAGFVVESDSCESVFPTAEECN